MTTFIPFNQASGDVRAAAIANLRWSPHDFVQTISVEEDRKMFIEHATRDLEAENDLRFIYNNKDGTIALLAERLPWDSGFFGFPIARLNAIVLVSASSNVTPETYPRAVAELLRELAARRIRYLFCAVDARDLAMMSALGRSRFSLIETRLFYHRALVDVDNVRFACRLATADDVPALAKAASETINPYDRFHADPMLRGKADELMETWIKASVTGGFADATVVPDSTNPGAFCTIKYHREKWSRWGVKLAQVVLIVSSVEFKGWFYKILAEVHHHLKQVGAEHCFYSTQIANRASVRVAEKHGYRCGRGEHIWSITL